MVVNDNLMIQISLATFKPILELLDMQKRGRNAPNTPLEVSFALVVDILSIACTIHHVSLRNRNMNISLLFHTPNCNLCYELYRLVNFKFYFRGKQREVFLNDTSGQDFYGICCREIH